MRLKTFLWGIILALAYSITLVPASFASQFSSGIQINLYSRGGKDADNHRYDERRNRTRYYRNNRYYPNDYFYYKKIYHYPSRKYYYYYDVYPEKTYYYGSEGNTVISNPDYLPLTSIANMGSQGVPDAVIISEIERTHSVYKLNSETITYLKQNGISDRVIDVLLKTQKKY